MQVESITQIEHSGIVKEIINDELKVSIINKSSCASCNLKGSCSVSDIQEKIVDVFVSNPQDYIVGENVDVFYRQSLGFRALFLGYLLPFIVLLVTMILMLELTNKELLSGLVSLFSLIPYYLIVYLTRNKIKKTFSFSVKKSFTYSPYLSALNI